MSWNIILKKEDCPFFEMGCLYEWKWEYMSFPKCLKETCPIRLVTFEKANRELFDKITDHNKKLGKEELKKRGLKMKEGDE